MTAYCISIQGEVQGVCFRAEAKRIADELRIQGWVRNCADGSVQIHAEGSDEALRQMVAWCNHGPPLASVKRVLLKKIDEQQCTTFEIRT